MELEKIIELIHTVSESNLTQFTMEEGNLKISMKTDKQTKVIAAPQTVAAVPAAVVTETVQTSVPAQENTRQVQEETLDGNVVKSPLVGTFYNAPSPDAEPYVKVGDTVKKGQVLAIVEAMKLMNEIESEFDGTVEKILVSNEEVVEYGQPLFVIKYEGKTMKLTTKEIMEIIPHRHPFLLVDTIEDMEPGVRAVGRKCVTYNEPFFAGHFPKEPIMPGVLQIEALAQVGAVAILSKPENKGKTAYFGAINNAKFKNKVVPGDVLTLEVEIIKEKGPVGVGKAVAKNQDGKITVMGEMTFMIG